MRPVQTSKAFGAAVRRARKSQGLTQADLAAKASVSRQWLSELETGKRTAELGRALSVIATLRLAITFVPIEDVGASGIDLGRILGEQ